MTMYRSGLVAWLACLSSVESYATAFISPMVTTSPTTERFYRDDKTTEDHDEPTSSWKRTEELWNQEWHDAFIRNGLTPPSTDHLFCLMVGNGLQGAKKVSSSPLPSMKESRKGQSSGSLEAAQATTNRAVHLVRHHNNQEGTLGDPRSIFRYDCILDTSWMNDLAMEENVGSKAKFGAKFIASRPTLDSLRKEAGTLLVEANQALQEHGIYVVITQRPLASSPILKKFLIEAGHSLGMQWQFDLEEISRGEVHVSVARKYCQGILPSSRHEGRPLGGDRPL